MRAHNPLQTDTDLLLSTRAAVVLADVLCYEPLAQPLSLFAVENGALELFADLVRAESARSDADQTTLCTCFSTCACMTTTDEARAAAYRGGWLPLLLGFFDCDRADGDTKVQAVHALTSLLCLSQPHELGVACRRDALDAGALTSLISVVGAHYTFTYDAEAAVAACQPLSLLLEAGGDAAQKLAAEYRTAENVIALWRAGVTAHGTLAESVCLALCALTHGDSAAARESALAAERAGARDVVDTIMRRARQARWSPVTRLELDLGAELLTTLKAAQAALQRDKEAALVAQQRAADDAMAALLAEDAAEKAARGAAAAGTSKKAKRRPPLLQRSRQTQPRSTRRSRKQCRVWRA